MVPSNSSYLSTTAIFPLNYDYGRKSHLPVFQKLGVTPPPNGWFILKNPIKMDDFGGNFLPIFGTTPSDFPPLLAAPQEHRMASFASTLQLHRRSQPSVIFQLSHVRFVNLGRLWFVI